MPRFYKRTKRTKPSSSTDIAEYREPFLAPCDGTYLTPLQTAYNHLPGGWRSYLRYVRIAKLNNDPTMRTLYDYITLELSSGRMSEAQLLETAPEDLCARANVLVMDLVGSIQRWIWVYAKHESGLIAASFNPAVITRLAKSAIGSSRNSSKDREIFLKMTGDLPVPSGSRILIQNSNMSTGPSHLPSASQDIKALESLDDVLDIEST